MPLVRKGPAAKDPTPPRPLQPPYCLRMHHRESSLSRGTRAELAHTVPKAGTVCTVRYILYDPEKNTCIHLYTADYEKEIFNFYNTHRAVIYSFRLDSDERESVTVHNSITLKLGNPRLARRHGHTHTHTRAPPPPPRSPLPTTTFLRRVRPVLRAREAEREAAPGRERFQKNDYSRPQTLFPSPPPDYFFFLIQKKKERRREREAHNFKVPTKSSISGHSREISFSRNEIYI